MSKRRNKKDVTKKAEKAGTTKPVTIEMPPHTKFILVQQEVGQNMSVQYGGFMNVDEALGFNRRCVNPQIVEQMILQSLQATRQKQLEEQQKNQAEPKIAKPKGKGGEKAK